MMTHDEYWDMTDDELNGEIDAEHQAQNRPAYTALLHRTFPTYTEVMWIHLYPQVKRIFVTYPSVAIPGGRDLPGFVQEISVAPRDMRSPERLRDRFETSVDSYLGMGWTRKEHEIR